MKELKAPLSFPSRNHAVEFKNVCFSYAAENHVVKNLSFSVPHRSITALVGPTGAGKSTIANLLLRYYDLASGEITIGGENLKNFSVHDLRTNIGLVSQDPFLFDTSIRENLLIANSKAKEPELWEALQFAKALDFVQRLPMGIDTMIGERGIRLSMGEKQRLTLARAIIKSSPILILDEATSSVDVETEKQIQDALKKLIKHRTTLIIAHRLSTIREADQIIFLDQGKIIETGTHDELLEINGSYANFCHLQQNLI